MLINPCVGVLGDKSVKDKVEEEYYYETEVKLPCDRTVGVQQKSLEELSTTHAAAVAVSVVKASAVLTSPPPLFFRDAVIAAA